MHVFHACLKLCVCTTMRIIKANNSVVTMKRSQTYHLFSKNTMKNNIGVSALSTWLTHGYKCFSLAYHNFTHVLGTLAQYMMHEISNLSSSLKHPILMLSPVSYKITYTSDAVHCSMRKLTIHKSL